ncbi:MAG: DUF1592 domain-containing protein [Myxococcaceae bacterium]|nr:DUF1592 domain-containing protein [Myxococcaceae bacterium]
MRRLFPLALSVAACTGVIGAPPPPPEAPAPLPPEPQCEHALVPGRPPLHRLTRLEFDQSVDAVLGDRSALAAANFPLDPSHAGFDHVSDVQTVSVLHAERYEEAAWKLAEALWVREFDPGLSKRWEAETRAEDGGYERVQQSCCGSNLYNNVVANGARGFWTAYRIFVQTYLDREADYTVRLSGWAAYPDGGTTTEDGGVRPLNWQVQLDSRYPFLSARVAGTRTAQQLYTATVHVDSPGVHQLDIWLDDETRLSDPPTPPVGWLDWFSIERASTAIATPKVRRCDLATGGAPCVSQTLSALMRRAYRRPVASPEVDAVVAVYDAALAAGDSQAEAFQAAVATVLLSPHFLYRVELDADLTSATPHPVSAHELAARLSYFLTSGPPDDALSAAADDGTLTDPSVLQSHAARLWGSGVMVQNAGAQLMSTRALDTISPSPQLFPTFDAPLKAAMGREAELLFASVFHQPQPMTKLVDADWSYLNDRLAQHYGLPLPGSATPVRVALSNTERGGALGLGSMLALNSTPARPSQVLRGKWVLTNLLCDVPDDPPAAIPPLTTMPGRTARESLEEHAKNPFCAGCHKRMDPIGFALDQYDADGAWRATDRQGQALDTHGQLPDGTTFEGLPQLRTALARDLRFEQCMALHLLTYALAREPKGDDRCQAESLAAKVHGQSFEALMREVVASEPFRMRQAEVQP